MKRIVFSIGLLAFVVHTCMNAIVIETPDSELLSPLEKATIDVLMTCYGDPGDAVGIVGDSGGSFLKTLWSKYLIPTVLINNEMEVYNTPPSSSKLHRLKVVLVVADSRELLLRLYYKLFRTIWWNHNANVLIMNKTPDIFYQSVNIEEYLYVSYLLCGMLNVQLICSQHTRDPIILSLNPFTPRATEHWALWHTRELYGSDAVIYVFIRRYQEGGQVCKGLNFDKTIDLGGYPLYFLTEDANFFRNHTIWSETLLSAPAEFKVISEFNMKQARWLVDNIVNHLNASALIIDDDNYTVGGFELNFRFLSDSQQFYTDTNHMIFPLIQGPLLAVTQHTGHMTQLDKILSVIDRTSRIGMYLVYLITFLFFKFFLRQSVVRSLLNLVRLTCNTGLTKLPQNVSATIYLACLFMFVVTLQAIYTGNLATLLTTTIPYPNVQRKQDIARLGYKVYSQNYMNGKIAADPMIAERIIEISDMTNCSTYILSDPLGACILERTEALVESAKRNLHMSRYAIMHDYYWFLITPNNPFKHRIEFLIKELAEHGLWADNRIIEALHNELVDDDEVKKNVERRVMTLNDLCFAFVILGIGLTCSIICFIGELVTYRIRLKIAKRRKRVRARLAWGVTEKKCSWFPSFNLRFNVRRLLSRRR